MKIVIVGAGQVGATLAENLAREYNDITVVDINDNDFDSGGEVEVNMSIYYSFCQNLEFERRFGASNSDSRGRFS